MNNFAPSDRPPTRGPRKGAIVALVLIAFVAGILLMAYAMRNLSWFNTNGTATQAVTAKPGGTGGTVKEAPRTDPMALATREAQLAAQLAALETRAATLSNDATAAGAQAGRAESILVAAAARRAVDRGQPLGYLEEQLRTRFGTSEPRAVAVLIATAILGLAQAVAAWLAALIIGVVLLIITAVLVLLGKKALERGLPPVPELAQASIKADVAAVKEGLGS